MIPRQNALLPLLALALSLGLAGDAPERGRALWRLVPGVDPQTIGHLIRDTPEGFRTYCRGIGLLRTQNAMSWLNAASIGKTPESHRRLQREVYPYVSQLTDVMSYEFDRPEFARIYQFRASLGDSSWSHGQALAELDRLIWDAASSLDTKLEGYRAVAARFARFGDERELMNIDANLAHEVMREELFPLRVQLLRSALARARWLCEHHMICQLLGELGDAYERMGHRDSVLACYEEGIARADRFMIPDQAARIRLFLGKFYLAEGRLALGAQILQEALAVSRRYDDGTQIRFLLNVSEYYARIHCWDVVERNSQRFPALLRAASRSGYIREAEHLRLSARGLRAACLATKGHAREAADSLERLLPDARATSRPGIVLPILLKLAEVQLQIGRARDALATARSGVAHAESALYQPERRQAARIAARAAIATHQYDLASSALLEAQRLGPGEVSTPREPAYVVDGLAARIALERGDVRLADRLVRRGLASLRSSIRSLDRGPHSDLTIQTAEDLRRAGHQLLANEPARELAFERHWRSLGSWGAGLRADRGTSPAIAQDRPRTLHLVYMVRPEGLVRWTEAASGIRRETLALDPLECREVVDRVFEMASTDPEDGEAPMPSELAAIARRLGRLLLPEELRSGGFDRVSISAEGPLARLPFELLDAADSGRYEPLLSRVEVRYARHVRPRPPPTTSGPTMVLADSGAIPPRNSRHGSLPRLAAVQAELARVLASLPDVRIVHGNETSKQALLEAWQRASIIYVAAHLVRDRDAPLFNYFPIAFGAVSRSREDDFLDIRDVRDTDLSRCRLVVLSSCASGEPYVAGTRSGPSMADAFVDAGAEAVIHTRWRVRDESAAETAPRLAKAWLERDSHGAANWRTARLDRMRGSRGIRHPFQWAAWSVTTAAPEAEWNGRGPLNVARAIASSAPHEQPAPNPARDE